MNYGEWKEKVSNSPGPIQQDEYDIIYGILSKRDWKTLKINLQKLCLMKRSLTKVEKTEFSIIKKIFTLS